MASSNATSTAPIETSELHAIDRRSTGTCFSVRLREYPTVVLLPGPRQKLTRPFENSSKKKQKGSAQASSPCVCVVYKESCVPEVGAQGSMCVYVCVDGCTAIGHAFSVLIVALSDVAG